MFNGKTHYKWSFSIAMLNYQRVHHQPTLPLHCATSADRGFFVQGCILLTLSGVQDLYFYRCWLRGFMRYAFLHVQYHYAGTQPGQFKNCLIVLAICRRSRYKLNEDKTGVSSSITCSFFQILWKMSDDRG